MQTIGSSQEDATMAQLNECIGLKATIQSSTSTTTSDKPTYEDLRTPGVRRTTSPLIRRVFSLFEFCRRETPILPLVAALVVVVLR